MCNNHFKFMYENLNYFLSFAFNIHKLLFIHRQHYQHFSWIPYTNIITTKKNQSIIVWMQFKHVHKYHLFSSIFSNKRIPHTKTMYIQFKLCILWIHMYNSLLCNECHKKFTKNEHILNNRNGINANSSDTRRRR